MAWADRAERIAKLEAAAAARILVLDGAMGTMIQRHDLDEAAFRGARFASWGQDLKGDNDLLSVTQPQIIAAIHTAFLDAGADIIQTNSFSATTIAQADYAMESIARELNVESGRVARAAADAKTAETPDKPRWVAGSIGPTNRTASISPDVNDPAARNVTFDDLQIAYREAAEGLMDGGVDIILIETVFDTLNAKAAIFGVEDAFDARGETLPVMISGTITDKSGRTLSGQTTEAFWTSVAHAKPFCVGLNCALGPADMRAHIETLSRIANTRVSAYPNAGLPNAFGEYDDTPEDTADHLGAWARAGFANILGGCCGTTPEHIAAVAKTLKDVAPRTPPQPTPGLRLSGLEAFSLIDDGR